jgi:hypothetical protein
MTSPTLRRYSYFPTNRPRVWWWKIVDSAGEIVADGFSSKREAAQALAAGTRSAETTGSVPKGCQSGPKGNAQKVQP